MLNNITNAESKVGAYQFTTLDIVPGVMEHKNAKIQVFDIPGMGRLSWDALIGRDYAVFLALLALTATFQLVGNLLSDILYMVIDPRIDFSSRA